MICARRSLLFVSGIVISVALFCFPASAQVATGAQPLGSFGGGPDVINLGNLNVHYTIPVRHKAGRGTDFIWDLKYDSSIWTPTGAVGSQSWVPQATWGWQGLVPAGQTYVTYSMQYGTGQCGYQGQSSYQVWNYGNFVYYDQFGVSTYLGGGVSYYSSPGGTCPPNGPEPPTVEPVTVGGYTLYANPGPGTVTGYVVDKSGTSFNSPFGTSPPSQQNPFISVDRNGNEITTNNGVISDTLGTTALSIVQAANTNLSYTAPSGATATYIVSYKTNVVRTNFGCSGITEYNTSRATQASLVDRVTLPDGSYFQFTYETTYGDTHTPHDVTGRIASVMLPTGGTISYLYATGGTGVNGIACSDGTATTLVRTTPDNVANPWTYARTQVGGAGTHWQTTLTDPASNQTMIDFQKDTTATGNFYETQRHVYQGLTSQTLLETLTTCYNTNTSNCTTTSVASPVTQQNVTTQFGSSGLQGLRVSSYNSNALLTEEDDYDYASGAPTTILKKTLITYASLGSILNMPATTTVCSASGTSSSCNGAGTPIAQTTYTYDQGTVTATSGTPQLVPVSGPRGNPTTIATLVQGTTTLNRTLTYYDTGTVKTATDVNGAVTTNNYPDANSTCGNAFPTSVSEPLSLSRSATWNCSGAVETQLTDENSKVTTTAYTDPYFWRPASFTDPANVITTYSYSTTAPFNWAEFKLTFNSGNSAVDSLMTADTLGRVHLKQRRQGPASSNYDTVETDYDSLGRVARVTMPYSGTSGQTSSTAPATTTTYDALSRPLIVMDGGGGTTTSSYSQNDILATIGPAPTGENTKRRQVEYNGNGQITSVCELTSTTGSGTCGQTSVQTGFWTKYTFDAISDLTGVTQNAQAPAAQQQARSYVFDGLGRLTSETNPEPGTSSYAYDASSGCAGTYSGDLVKRTDAVGNTTCFAYDQRHRQISAIYSGPYSAVTPNKYFVYDSATVNSLVMVNAKARLAEAYTAATQTGAKITDSAFSYSDRGQTSDVYESTPHSSGYYHMTETYWATGLPLQLSGLPGLPSITYGGTIGSTVGLDGEGRITQVTASSGQNPVPNTVYNMLGMPTTINYGSSDSDGFSYDVSTGRMTQYKFNVNGQSDTGTLTWNANGTLGSLVIADALNSADTQSCAYGFDDLQRVASVNCGSSIWSQTFGFDAFGNITKNGTMTFQPVYKNPTTGYTSNRFVSVPGITVSYDANGNVGNDGAHTYSWDAENRPVTIDGVNITYDALKRAVEQNRSGAYTEIVYAPTGEKLAFMTGQTVQKARVKLPGNASALYTSAGLSYYRHPDWLGSIRLGSTTARAMYSDVAYAPFGETYAHAGAADYSFAGMDQDTVSGDYDASSREYNTQGRWPSPDPSGSTYARIGFPQSWNRYAYSLNNPLSLLDPSGLDCVYLNDGGSAAESIDTSSSAGECGSSGGYWIPGTVDASTITVNSNSGLITASSDQGAFVSGCNGDGCGSDPSGNLYGSPNLANLAPQVLQQVIQQLQQLQQQVTQMQQQIQQQQQQIQQLQAQEGGWCSALEGSGQVVLVGSTTLFVVGTILDGTVVGAPAGLLSQGSATIGMGLSGLAIAVAWLGQKAGVCH